MERVEETAASAGGAAPVAPVAPAAAAALFCFINGSSSPKIPVGASAAGPKVGGAARGLAAPMRSRFIDS